MSFLLSTTHHNRCTAVVPHQTSRSTTALSALIPESEMSEDQKKILDIQKKWSEVRRLSREEAASQLEGDWLEAHTRFFDKFDEDMTKMTEISQLLQKALEPPKVAKKTLGQKRRDKWARIQAREAARAGN